MALLAGCFSLPAQATTLTVPDQVPTIQAAVDALVDTILVRAGAYPETVVILQSFSLMAAADPSGERPAIAGLTIRSAPVMFRDLRFDTRITVINGYRDDIGFVRCDLRDGVVDITGEVWTDNFKLFKCLLGGSITPAARFLVRVDSCQVTGHVSVRSKPDLVFAVVGCTFQGDGTGYGIAGGGVVASYAVGNTVRGYATGISVGGQEETAADNNLVEDCSGIGLIAGGSFSAYVRNNVVRRCGRGMEVRGDRLSSVSGNTVTESVGAGLGVSSESFNVVGNVVSRSGGDGIWVWGNGRVIQNTSCLNSGSGLVSFHYYDGYQTAEFTRNVGYRNGSYGIQWRSVDPATVGCNDWHANQAGAAEGRPPAAEDFSEDPQFCDPQAGDFHLQADSPLLDRAGCGQVGALGLGCATTATLVQRFSGERVREGIRVVWEVAAGATASVVWLERSDASSGAGWMRPATERSIDNRAVVELDRSAVSDRAYWYRLVALEGNDATVIGQPILVEGEARLGFRLVEVGANPGSGPVRIAFALEQAAAIEIDVFDVLGRRVASPGAGVWPAGTHELVWDGRTRNGQSAPAGMYVVRYLYPGWQDRRCMVRLP